MPYGMVAGLLQDNVVFSWTHELASSLGAGTSRLAPLVAGLKNPEEKFTLDVGSTHALRRGASFADRSGRGPAGYLALGGLAFGGFIVP